MLLSEGLIVLDLVRLTLLSMDSRADSLIATFVTKIYGPVSPVSEYCASCRHKICRILEEMSFVDSLLRIHVFARDKFAVLGAS